LKERYEQGNLVWVAPGAVRYTPEHVDFLLPWLLHLREGTGPHEPSGGYAGKSKTSRSHRAHFEAWAQVAAELDLRLSATGLDRYLVEDAICRQIPVAELARRLGMDEWEVGRRIRSAVSYISSGPCPRWLNCIDCPKYSKCRRKKRAGLTYADWKRHRRRNWSKAKLPHVRSGT